MRRGDPQWKVGTQKHSNFLNDALKKNFSAVPFQSNIVSRKTIRHQMVGQISYADCIILRLVSNRMYVAYYKAENANHRKHCFSAVLYSVCKIVGLFQEFQLSFTFSIDIVSM